jgi:hypothetical protein
MITKRIVSMMKPINWIGFLPQLSMKMNDTQYPGMRPATARIKFPTQMFIKLSYTPRVPFVTGVPKPMA